MGLLKSFFRYKLVTVYFIVGQLIIYATIFGALQIYNIAKYKEYDRKESIYDNRITVDINTSYEEANILSKAAKGIDKGNVLLGGRMTVNCKEFGSATRAEMLLAVNEDLPYKMEWGHIPGTVETDYGKRVVALGRDKFRYASERDGKYYVTIFTEEYEVVGLIGSVSDFWDYKVVLNINCIGEKTLYAILESRAFKVNIDSNTVEMSKLQEQYNKLFENVKDVDYYATLQAAIDKSKGQSTVANTYARQKGNINVVVYIFCVVNCVLVSYFWITKRRKEIAIRKAFGYSDFRIIRMLFAQMAAMMLFSLVLFLVLYAMLNWCIGDMLHIYFTWDTLVGVVTMMVITAVLSVAYPAYRVLGMKSSQSVM